MILTMASYQKFGNLLMIAKYATSLEYNKMTSTPGSYRSMEEVGSYQSSGRPSAGSGRAQTARPSTEFNRLNQLVVENIQKMTQSVSDMNKMIGLIGTTSDNSELRDKLHRIQHQTNQLAKETNGNLKDLVHVQALTSSEQRQWKLQRDRLTNDFSAILNSFQSAQRKQKDREKETIQRTKTKTQSIDLFGDDEELTNDQLFGLPDKQKQTTIEMDTDMELLKEREQTVRQLEMDISDVNQIFKDLSMMVHEQGEVIDSIEANVESSALNVSRGTDELQKARSYQSRVRRRKFCLLVIFLVVIAIVITIIAVAASKG